jgi:uncharacterized protein
MKILLDIGHPAHVHYFRNSVRLLEKRGHQFVITTRDKEVTLDLLRSYGFDYTCTGRNKAGFINKFLTMIRNDIAVYKVARKFKPDLFLSFFSPFAAQVGWLLRKPVIGFTDTEFAKLSIRLTKPFTGYIFTPQSFWTEFGKNHYRFKGFMETFYLHPHYFTPDPSVLPRLGFMPGEKFFIMRFVSFSAGHDAGESGMNHSSKIEIAEYLASKGKLVISSEAPLPAALEKYRMRLPPAHFHSILAFASMYVGEGITTASECALLGTPAVLINTLTTGYIKEQEERGLVFQFKTAEAAIPRIRSLADLDQNKRVFTERRDKMIADHIDCTAFITELIDEFPASVQRLNNTYALT